MRVLLVDDHTVVRTALAALLAREPDIDIVGEAANGQQAVEVALALQPDVILMDISMPVLNGIEATRIIRAACPGITVIGLSMFHHKEQAQPMLDAGAAGYVCKSDPVAVLLNALRQAASRRTAPAQ